MQSYLTPLDPPVTARFHGNLDTTTLGGAGFASQRTSTETQVWDLASYSGILLRLQEWDDKTYAFTLKDEIPSKYVDEKTQRPREEASVSWEFKFTPSTHKEKTSKDSSNGFIIMLWRDFTPTYRGRELKDLKPLDLKNIRRMSLMMRSFFGAQEGEFSLTLASIEAVTIHKEHEEVAKDRQEGTEEQKDVGSETDSQDTEPPKAVARDQKTKPESGHRPRRVKWLLSGCWSR